MKAFSTACIAGLALALNHDPSNHFAVLVAGSTGYSNYRHQADVAHAYKIMEKNGIPKKNIVHMAYDDIAYNRKNPF